jgi:hypothetical protein
MVFLTLRGFALLLLVFLHGFALFLAYLLHGFLVLLGCLLGEAKVVLGARILGFGSGGYRVSGAEGEEQQEKRNSFHHVSGGKILQRFYTEAG